MGRFNLPSDRQTTWGISHRFQWLFPSLGQVTYVLLTRLPLSPSDESKGSRSTCMC